MWTLFSYDTSTVVFIWKRAVCNRKYCHHFCLPCCIHACKCFDGISWRWLFLHTWSWKHSCAGGSFWGLMNWSFSLKCLLPSNWQKAFNPFMCVAKIKSCYLQTGDVNKNLAYEWIFSTPCVSCEQRSAFTIDLESFIRVFYAESPPRKGLFIRAHPIMGGLAFGFIWWLFFSSF